MQTFKQFNEVLATPYKLTTRSNVEYDSGKLGMYATFKSDNGITYTVMGQKNGDTEAEIKAKENKPKPAGLVIPSNPRRGGEWEIHFSQADYDDDERDISADKSGIEGTGDAFKILATVLDFVKLVVNRYEPVKILLKSKSDENSRTSLYLKLVNKYASSLGYKVVKTEIDSENQHVIIIDKIQK
jgi:hypothetical protein